MGKVPSWVWLVVAALVVWVLYQRGVFRALFAPPPPVQKNPTAPPATGAITGDMINSWVSSAFGLAKSLAAPDTGVKSL